MFLDAWRRARVVIRALKSPMVRSTSQQGQVRPEPDAADGAAQVGNLAPESLQERNLAPEPLTVLSGFMLPAVAKRLEDGHI